MTDSQNRRFAVPDRARRRAIRLHAARTGVPYMEAARQLAGTAGMVVASRGRTIYPSGTDGRRQKLIDARHRRSLAERIVDARVAADLPAGRATHLVERFPVLHAGPGVGVLYGGEARADVLAILYAVVIHERPDLEPAAADLTWEAELGEETAVDTACNQLDRAVRLLLDDERPLWPRVDAATRAVAPRRNGWGNAAVLARHFFVASIDGARQTLDVLLMVADDGHAPGTRVRPLPGGTDVAGTIVGARWGLSGPPIGYRVQTDCAATSVAFEPRALVVLDGQGSEQ